MHTLEKRLAALELSASPDNRITTIICKIISPGMLNTEMQRFTQDGVQWTREDGETEPALRDRATREARHNGGGFAVLIGWPDTVEVAHA